MVRYRLLIEYHGGPFVGWQKLPDLATIQGALETAAAKLDGAPVRVYGAGRTDSGVHALGQVAHIDLSQDRGRKVADALNAHLRPLPIAVLKAERVDEDFHARFSAKSRHYRYVIINRRAALTVDKGLAWRMPMKLDTALMNQEAKVFLGTHDFSTFRDAACQAKSPVRTIDAIEVERFGERVEITVSARSFLHRQVRSMVGSLVDVGRGRRSAGWIAEILEACERTACGPIAPPDGLFLERVEYDDESGVAGAP